MRSRAPSSGARTSCEPKSRPVLRASKADDVVRALVADHADRVPALLHRLDGVAQHPPIEHDAAVGGGEVLQAPVVDALAALVVLRGVVLRAVAEPEPAVLDALVVAARGLLDAGGLRRIRRRLVLVAPDLEQHGLDVVERHVEHQELHRPPPDAGDMRADRGGKNQVLHVGDAVGKGRDLACAVPVALPGHLRPLHRQLRIDARMQHRDVVIVQNILGALQPVHMRLASRQHAVAVRRARDCRSAGTPAPDRDRDRRRSRRRPRGCDRRGA